MPSLRDIRRRVKSVEGIRQITRAMQMVAATKLRRAQGRAESARPYTEKMTEMVKHLARVVRTETSTEEGVGIAQLRVEETRPHAYVLDKLIGEFAGSAKLVVSELEEGDNFQRELAAEIGGLLRWFPETVWGGVLSEDHLKLALREGQRLRSELEKALPASVGLHDDTLKTLKSIGETLDSLAGILFSDFPPFKADPYQLTVPRDKPRSLLILAIGSDKGLCGSFNSNLIRKAESVVKKGMSDFQEVEILAIGRKVLEYFSKRKVRVRPESEHYTGIPHDLPLDLLQRLTNLTTGMFLAGRFDRVEMVFTDFTNVATQRAVSRVFLPIEELKLARDRNSEADREHVEEYLFEPEPRELLGFLIPKYARQLIFDMLTESIASEHAARMMAMRNATENAAEMIDALILLRNKVRQASITKELSEIVGGAEALRG